MLASADPVELAHDSRGSGPLLVLVHGIAEDRRSWDPLTNEFAVQVPYLSLFGTDPGAGYPDWLSGLVPTARVETWDGVGHYPHLVDPDRFLTVVREFEETL